MNNKLKDTYLFIKIISKSMLRFLNNVNLARYTLWTNTGPAINAVFAYLSTFRVYFKYTPCNCKSRQDE